MRNVIRALALFALVLVVASTVLPSSALAHERRKVGKYELVVGWLNEPALVEATNGIDFRVTNAETNQPVEGLEKTAKVEVTAGGKSRTFELRPRFRQPGAYTADLMPTRAGSYIFRFSGSLEGTPLDERFESGPGRFHDIESPAEMQFPESQPTLGELAKAFAGTEQNARAARDAASSAQTLGIAGLIVGGLGVALGAVSLATRRR